MWYRVILKDAAKAHSIVADVDTTYEDFSAELKSKAEDQLQDIAEPMRLVARRLLLSGLLHHSGIAQGKSSWASCPQRGSVCCDPWCEHSSAWAAAIQAIFTAVVMCMLHMIT